MLVYATAAKFCTAVDSYPLISQTKKSMQCLNRSEKEENSQEVNFPEEEITQNRDFLKRNNTGDKKWGPRLQFFKANQISS